MYWYNHVNSKLRRFDPEIAICHNIERLEI